jgi:drug/metabolite transporter (DMT)-like permease
MSTASILIRYAQAQGMGELAIAAYRMTFATLVLAPFATTAGLSAWRRFSMSERARVAAAGAVLAVHFAAWISSLALTSVASSVALVNSHPLWVAAAGFVLFREKPGWMTITGIALTLAGGGAIMYSDQTDSPGAAPLAGNFLAVAGAVSMAAYILLARSMRMATGTLAYVWVVYAIAAGLLLAVAAGRGLLIQGINTMSLLLMAALAIGPQLVGHTAINHCARHLRTTMVSIATLAEPVLSALMAWLLIGEGIAPLQFAGFAATLGGIALCALEDRYAVTGTTGP